ncbi:succinyldiaminopimelate transaminase [Corynebacterium glyciniphilum]|uniref:succinyldiaminopimelate transaminase n=1 Tax=Corynebacterium glyciniphilum TaxID=1404244 RepID=UPI002650278C|nr:succinyldiaminopimelate transaminase [Corynebacterium glyciniphilum]MDN5683415.1 succinyldiaminopimelate transaminase [Corynebacterium glyciniphilum]MDN6705977.1 succinyldiaminopimelate transaminase [Corynebacterium glyciniphilum]
MSSRSRRTLSSELPDFPWDSLSGAKQVASSHPDGLVDLSVGTPVDEVAPSIQLALAEAAAAPGYPQTVGTPELRRAVVEALARRFGVTGVGEDAVLPVVGTKEAIAWLPFLLGVMPGQTVVIPELAYPTYEVGARLAGARAVRSDSLLKFGPETPTLIFINSPANPHGKVLGIDHLRKVVEFARERDVVVVSDECYLGLGWSEEDAPVSILDPRVSDGDHTNLIAVHSLSKTSNLASYRSGFLVGDRGLIGELLSVRKNAGLMMPGPVQAATVAALEDDGQEILQKERYRERRELLSAAVEAAGLRIDDSDGGLYLWATEGRPCRDTVDRLARLGILVAPGDFYGPGGAEHVRIGLTATDMQIVAAARRLAAGIE